MLPAEKTTIDSRDIASNLKNIEGDTGYLLLVGKVQKENFRLGDSGITGPAEIVIIDAVNVEFTE